MTHKEIFERQGYVLVKNFIPRDVAKYLFEYLKFNTLAQIQSVSGSGDAQVPEALWTRYGDPAFESLMKISRYRMEDITGLKLFPTYTYSRLYRSGNSLAKHTDRDACEVSVTLKLSDTGGYNWPIWIVDSEIALDDGDAVIYRGCELIHWRETCGGPDSYRMGQVFMHYVNQDGPCADFKFDKREGAEALFMTDS